MLFTPAKTCYSGYMKRKHFNTQTLILTALSFFLFLGLATLVAVSNSRQTRDNRSQASVGMYPVVNLSPSEYQSDFVGSQFEVTVKINTNDQVIGGISGSLDYNPAHLSVKNVALGPFFTQISATTPSGKIDFYSQEKVVGEGTVATITFEVISNSFNRSEIELNDDFIVWDSQRNYNSLYDIPNPVVVLED